MAWDNGSGPHDHKLAAVAFRRFVLDYYYPQSVRTASLLPVSRRGNFAVVIGRRGRLNAA